MKVDEKTGPEMLLAGARRAWSPTPDDLSRVERALGAALAAAPSSARAETTSPARADGQRRADGTEARAAIRAGWLGRVLVTAAFTTAGTGIGYWSGRRAHLPPPVVVATAERPAAMATSEASASPPASRSSHEVGALTLPGDRPNTAGALASAGAARPHRPAANAKAGKGLRPMSSESTLAEEARALRNVERALRENRPGLATAFLDELEQRIPEGQLREERVALRTIARCQDGHRLFGVDEAKEFEAAYPASAYQHRIEDACQGTDRGPSGDSASRR